MASQAYTNCKLWVGEYDLSGHMNAIAVEYGADMLDDTTFGNTSHTRKGGAKSVTANHEGFLDPENSDAPIFSKFATQDVPMSVCPQDGTAGDIAYFFRSALSEYSPGASFGEMLAFSVTAEATEGGLVRGVVGLNESSLTASGNGTGQELGAVSSSQSLYAALHVLSGSGTLDMVVESDDNSGFTTATTRITFTQATGATSEFKSVSGAIADTWFRGTYTIAGASPDFSAVLVLGIQ